jgi:hypothetical protein
MEHTLVRENIFIGLEGGFAPANHQSLQNADDSQPLCGGLPSGESTLQIIRLTAFCPSFLQPADNTGYK